MNQSDQYLRTGIYGKEGEWVLKVRKGDVLEMPSGALRIVRKVHDNTAGRLKPGVVMARRINFFFAIMHCSWTHAGYTIYNGGELLQYGWKPIGVRQRLGTELDRKLEADFGKHSAERCLTCCDIVGLP